MRKKKVRYELKIDVQMYDESAEELKIIVQRLFEQNNHLFRNIGQINITEVGPNKRHLRTELEKFFEEHKNGAVK